MLNYFNFSLPGMSRFYYLNQELYHRFGRRTVTLVSVWLVVPMVISLTAISNASSDALRLSLENIGAYLVVQLYGDIPKKLEGLVFLNLTAQLFADAVERNRNLPEVIRSIGTVFCVTCLQVNFSHFWELTLQVHQESIVWIHNKFKESLSILKFCQ